MTIFFTADTHLGHKNIITSTNRPFKSVTAMDSAIIKRWNERVTPRDLVYHLGDFAFDDHDPYLELLNGQKHLILGNHDYSDRVNKATLWQGIRELKELKVGETKIVLCHYALRTWNGSHRGALQLYGHSHGGLAGDSQSLDVGVDCWDFRPVTLDEIKERLATMPKRVELDHHRPSE